VFLEIGAELEHAMREASGITGSVLVDESAALQLAA
jgi:hypothetical protein